MKIDCNAHAFLHAFMLLHIPGITLINYTLHHIEDTVVFAGSDTGASYSHASGSYSVSVSYLTYIVTAIVIALLLGTYDGTSCEELSVHMGLFIPKDDLRR